VAKPRGRVKPHENLTFRLDASIMETVRRDSAVEGFTLNSIATRQFQQYMEWDRLEAKIGFATVRNRGFRSMLSKISAEDIAAIGREQGPVEVREYILLRWATVNLENFVHFVENYARFATQFQLEHQETGEHVLILVHGLGEKWSIYLEAFMTSALEVLLGIHAKSQRTDESLALTFSGPLLAAD
jgi:hypothetical protein